MNGQKMRVWLSRKKGKYWHWTNFGCHPQEKINTKSIQLSRLQVTKLPGDVRSRDGNDSTVGGTQSEPSLLRSDRNLGSMAAIQAGEIDAALREAGQNAGCLAANQTEV